MTDSSQKFVRVFEWGALAQFAAKACIVAAVIAVSTIVVVDRVIGLVEQSAARSVRTFREEMKQTSIGGAQFWGKIEQELARAADPKSDLPPEQKQRLINQFRAIVVRWRPFVDAVVSELPPPKP